MNEKAREVGKWRWKLRKTQSIKSVTARHSSHHLSTTQQHCTVRPAAPAHDPGAPPTTNVGGHRSPATWKTLSSSKSTRAVLAQAQNTRFNLKPILSFSVSNFETGCFQARVKLAPPRRAAAAVTYAKTMRHAATLTDEAAYITPLMSPVDAACSWAAQSDGS